VPHSVAISDLVTIETEHNALSMSATSRRWSPPGGDHLADRPGPDDLAGYRLEKREGTAAWVTLVALTKETSYHDPSATPGALYRLFGVNGLGQELLLGETHFQ
jgi:hypothetical protein